MPQRDANKVDLIFHTEIAGCGTVNHFQAATHGEMERKFNYENMGYPMGRTPVMFRPDDECPVCQCKIDRVY